MASHSFSTAFETLISGNTFFAHSRPGTAAISGGCRRHSIFNKAAIISRRAYRKLLYHFQRRQSLRSKRRSRIYIDQLPFLKI